MIQHMIQKTATADFTLDEADVRAIVRLLGEVIATRGDLNVSRRTLMDGLCALIGADSWLWCMADIEPGKKMGHSNLLHGGFDEEGFSKFLIAINHPAMGKINHRIGNELIEKKCHITRTLDAVEDPACPLFTSEAGAFWQEAGIGTLMLSLRPLETGGLNGIGIYRWQGRPHFGERENRIAHILLTEVRWLHYTEFPEREAIARLYPRHRTILNLLCEGWDRKKIARHLGISPNTVHGYLKEIFRHFGVSSQAELIARMSKGDGNDRR